MPSGVDQLVQLRNRIAHPNFPLGRVETVKLLQLATDVMEHLAGDGVPLMPLVVVIEEERRHIREGQRWIGRTDTGQEEHIHTDYPLVLGQRYFLLPHSNPIRVFPTIVALSEN